MKVYIVFSASADLDPYEGRHYETVDSVWLSLEKAKIRIKALLTEWMKVHIHSECCENCECLSGHECFYREIKEPSENEIIINLSDFEQESFYIEEHELDALKSEAG